MTKKTGVENRRLMFTKNLIMMLVMLVIIFLAVFAWYSVRKNVTATGITVTASLPDEVEIAIEDENHVIGNYVTEKGNTSFKAGVWTDKVMFNGPFQFSEDVTSDGANFLIPAFNTTENNDDAEKAARQDGKIVNINGIPTTGLKTNLDKLEEGETPKYVSIPFYLRSRNSKITVKPSAYLAMAAENTQGAEITGANSVRKSSYGDFTSDALVAAMRVSIVGNPITSINAENKATTDGTSACKFIWVPRPDLKLTLPETYLNLQSEDTTNWTLTQGLSDPSGSTYRHDFYKEKIVDGSTVGVTKESMDVIVNNKYVGDDNLDKNDVIVSNPTQKKQLANGSVPTMGSTCNITNFGEGYNVTEIDGYYYFKYNLNLWIEGTDSEARRAMDTGQFNLFIEFGNS